MKRTEEEGLAMPLGDHFHPPLSQERRWEGVHTKWANVLVVWLRSLSVSETLPTLPLAISGEVRLPIDLEASYVEACRRLRLSE